MSSTDGIAKSLLKEKLLVGNGTLCDFAMGIIIMGFTVTKIHGFSGNGPKSKAFLSSEFSPIGKRRKNS